MYQHHDFENINRFEAATISMMVVGIIIIGSVFFSSLTPTAQASVKASVQVLDVHQQVSKTKESIAFIFSIPGTFYKEFYLAFEQVATVPSEPIEFMGGVAKELHRNVSVALNVMHSQLVEGYSQQLAIEGQYHQRLEIAYDGKVMGAAIAIADRVEQVSAAQARTEKVNIPYSFEDLNPIILTRMVDAWNKNTKIK